MPLASLYIIYISLSIFYSMDVIKYLLIDPAPAPVQRHHFRHHRVGRPRMATVEQFRGALLLVVVAVYLR